MTEPTTQSLIDINNTELIARLEPFVHGLGMSILRETADVIETQTREVERLQVEAEQLRKGHFDASETASVLRAELAAVRAQEPVALRWPNSRGRHDYCDYGETVSTSVLSQMLYASPVAGVNAVLVEALEKVCEVSARCFSHATWEALQEIADKALAAAKQAQPERAPLTMEQCKAMFEAWYASAPDAEPEPDRTYELSDESMSELTKDCIWLGWQAALTQQAQKGGE